MDNCVIEEPLVTGTVHHVFPKVLSRNNRTLYYENGKVSPVTFQSYTSEVIKDEFFLCVCV